MRRLRLAMAGLLALAALLTTTAALAEPLTRVDAKHVCMVNNTAFEKDQIPVEVGGKTYFGCCEMCKGRLAQDSAVRSAVDPVSGRAVDKAAAVIGKTPDGKVLYFENEKNLAVYAGKAT